MASLSCIYFSNTGNTEQLAEAAADAAREAGFDLYFERVEDADADKFLESDILCFASPACGTEEVDDTEMIPFIDSIKDRLDGRKYFLFGTFGWGGGEYAETWNDEMQSYGAEPVHDPYTCEEEPDDDEKAEIAEIIKSFA